MESAVFTTNDLSYDNSMALTCMAKSVISLTSEQQIEAFMADYDSSVAKKIPLFVLSGGSNVLLPAQLNAIVLRPLMTGIKMIHQAKDYVDIEVMAGENWHELVTFTVDKGWYGLENLALIPGLTGAAPVQNIGAYGVQLEDTLQYVRAYHLPTKTWQHLIAADCEFAYRDSLFKREPNTWLITRVAFRLHTDKTKIVANYGDVQMVAQGYANEHNRSSVTPDDIMQAIIKIRQQKIPDPKELPNCGSFFQNPIIDKVQFIELQASYPKIVGYPMLDDKVKVAAGWLIEQAGLKGDGVAPILTHKQQALVLTNHSPYCATQADVAKAQDYIIGCVYDKFKIKLTREPIWINADASIELGTYVV